MEAEKTVEVIDIEAGVRRINTLTDEAKAHLEAGNALIEESKALLASLPPIRPVEERKVHQLHPPLRSYSAKSPHR